MKTLIAYFSWSNNTKKLVDKINEKKKYDVIRIERAIPYSDDYDICAYKEAKEEVNKKIPGYVTGRLSNNAVVHFEGNKEDIGQLVNVRLNEAKGFYYMGEIVR